MKQFTTQSYTNTQTYYQNTPLVNFYCLLSLTPVIIGVLLALKIVRKKEQRTHKLQQQIKKLEKIYLLECEDNNVR